METGFSPSKVGRLFVNAKLQSIDYFDVIDFATLSAEEARDPRQRRLYLLVFDLSFSFTDLAPGHYDRIYCAVGHGFSEVGASSSAVTRVGNPSVTVSSRTHEP